MRIMIALLPLDRAGNADAGVKGLHHLLHRFRLRRHAISRVLIAVAFKGDVVEQGGQIQDHRQRRVAAFSGGRLRRASSYRNRSR